MKNADNHGFIKSVIWIIVINKMYMQIILKEI